MKSFGQIIENQVHKTVRKKVRAAAQTGSILNVIDSEINAMLTHAINQRLLGRAATIARSRSLSKTARDALSQRL